MKAVLVFCLALCLWSVESLFAQTAANTCLTKHCWPEDHCLALMYEGAANANPDSIRFDTCHFSDLSSRYSTYARQFFYVRFKQNIKPRPQRFPADTIIELSWQDIDSQFVQLRASFDTLEQRFGSFVFREAEPSAPDTTAVIPRRLLIRFDQYVNIDSVEDYLSTIQLVDIAYYAARDGFPSSIQSIAVDDNTIYPIPASDFVTIGNILNFGSIPTVYSLTGGVQNTRFSISSKSIILDVSQLPAGTYLVNFRGTTKLIQITR